MVNLKNLSVPKELSNRKEEERHHGFKVPDSGKEDRLLRRERRSEEVELAQNSINRFVLRLTQFLHR